MWIQFNRKWGLARISPLKLMLQLLMLTFTEMNYSLGYNTLISENLIV